MRAEDQMMSTFRLLRWISAGVLLLSVAACGGSDGSKPPAASSTPAAASPTPAPTASPSAASAASANERCPITVEQVNAVTGVPMELTAGACTFFPTNGRDIPHVFFVLQNPMVCTSIQPSEIGFKEKVDGLAAREAYVRDQLDGTHVLVCRDNNARAFDVVVDIKHDKAKNREAAIALAKQVLAAR